jgi:hypothetical protein
MTKEEREEKVKQIEAAISALVRRLAKASDAETKAYLRKRINDQKGAVKLLPHPRPS